MIQRCWYHGDSREFRLKRALWRFWDALLGRLSYKAWRLPEPYPVVPLPEWYSKWMLEQEGYVE